MKEDIRTKRTRAVIAMEDLLFKREPSWICVYVKSDALTLPVACGRCSIP
jgi:hypothetical protein